MGTSSRTASYSFDYAANVVEQFCMSYSRATIFVAHKLEMDNLAFVKAMITAFRYDQPRWRAIRDTLKAVHNQNLYAQIRNYTYDEAVLYFTAVKQESLNLPLYEKNNQLDLDI